MADLPGIGKVNKKWFLWVGGGTVVVLGYFYLRKRNQAAASTAAAGTPGAFDPNAIDPATGLTYAEEAAGGTGTGFLPGGSGGVITPTPPAQTIPGAGGFTTNGEWAQQAESDLGGLVSPGALSEALGKYLTGQAVDHAEQSLIDQAIAFEGYPPVHGAHGYPPSIRHQPSSSGGGQKAKVTVPDVLGKSYGQASAELSRAGLKARRGNPQVPIVARQVPAARTREHRGSTVTLFGPETG